MTLAGSGGCLRAAIVLHQILLSPRFPPVILVLDYFSLLSCGCINMLNVPRAEEDIPSGDLHTTARSQSQGPC